MTFGEIIAEIEAHPNTIRVTQEVHPGHVFCRVVYYMDELNNLVGDEAVNIILIDELTPGDPDAQAHYQKKLAYMKSDSPFKEDLLARISTIMAAQSDFKFYDIVSVDDVMDKAIIRTYWLDTGKLTERQYGAYREADSSIGFIEIV